MAALLPFEAEHFGPTFLIENFNWFSSKVNDFQVCSSTHVPSATMTYDYPQISLLPIFSPLLICQHDISPP